MSQDGSDGPLEAHQRFTVEVAGDCDIKDVRRLFEEYVGSLDVDLAFQGIDDELATLPGKYAPPRGVILMARDYTGAAVGCVALRPLDDGDTCEIKRLFVRETARGQGLGRQLTAAVIAHAETLGYTRIKLDTLSKMHSARRMYESFGFRETEAYYTNPLPGTAYMALQLRQP